MIRPVSNPLLSACGPWENTALLKCRHLHWVALSFNIMSLSSTGFWKLLNTSTGDFWILFLSFFLLETLSKSIKPIEMELENTSGFQEHWINYRNNHFFCINLKFPRNYLINVFENYQRSYRKCRFNFKDPKVKSNIDETFPLKWTKLFLFCLRRQCWSLSRTVWSR